MVQFISTLTDIMDNSSGTLTSDSKQNIFNAISYLKMYEVFQESGDKLKMFVMIESILKMYEKDPTHRLELAYTYQEYLFFFMVLFCHFEQNHLKSKKGLFQVKKKN